MSEHKNQNVLPIWVQIMSIGYLLIGSFVCIVNPFVWSMGPCPAFSSNTGCHWSGGYAFWLFPGSQLTFVMTTAATLISIKRRWNP